MIIEIPRPCGLISVQKKERRFRVSYRGLGLHLDVYIWALDRRTAFRVANRNPNVKRAIGTCPDYLFHAYEA